VQYDFLGEAALFEFHGQLKRLVLFLGALQQGSANAEAFQVKPLKIKRPNSTVTMLRFMRDPPFFGF
jgi:hypothetical protein